MCLSEVVNGLLDTQVTWSDIENEMQKCLGTAATFGENKTVQRIGEDSGFVSKMALVHPDWQNGTKELPEKFLVKIVSPLTGTSLFAVDESVSKLYRFVHNVEIHAYEMLAKYGENNIKTRIRLYFGIFEGCTLQIFGSIPFSEDNLSLGFIIMEYLDDLDFRHFCDDLSYEQVKQVIPSLVTIQSITPQLSDEELKKFPENIFYNIYSHFFTKEKMAGHINNISTMEDGYFSDLKEELVCLTEEIFDPEYLRGVDQLSVSIGTQPILQHNDVWAANLLWRKDDSLAAVIDFQLLAPGSCAMDIVKLVLHMNGEERRLRYKEILREYYEAAKEKFGDKIPYTFEQLHLSYDKLFPVASMIITWGTGPYLKMARQHRGEQAVAPLLTKIRMIFEDALRCTRNGENILNE